MRIEPVELVEVELENDPTTPKTRWSIHRMSYSEARQVEAQVGPRPVQAFFVYGKVHPARSREEIDAEKALPKDEQKRLIAERIDAAMARLAELSAEERAAYDIAIDWFERYDFAVCRAGIAKVDGAPVDDVGRLLDEMRPVESVRVVVGELAGKIAKLAEIDAEKKERSPSPPG